MRKASGSPSLFPFCPGRSDALDGTGSAGLEPRQYANGGNIAFKDNCDVAGLTARECVALAARPRTASYMVSLGFSGTWTSNPGELSNDYFRLLLNTTWWHTLSASGKSEFKRGALCMTPEDLVIKHDQTAIVQEFASNKAKWLTEFGRAWTKMMVADRFKGPAGNECGTL